MFKQDDVNGAAVHDGVLQTRALHQCPELLFIRFARDGYGSLQPCKLQHHVQFGWYFSVGSEVYRLKAVIEHLGMTMTNGHYVAYCREDCESDIACPTNTASCSNTWWKFNDAACREVLRTEVVLTVAAFILVYERQFPARA